MQSFERFMASRYLFSKNRDGFLSVIASFSFIGICIGVATLIIVMSVMGGFREELLSRIIGMKGHAVIYGTEKICEKEAMTQIVPALFRQKGIVSVSPLLEQQGIISAQDQGRGAIILAMTPETLANRHILSDHLTMADGFTLQNFTENQIILGKRMAEILKISIGDFVTLINPQGENTPFGTLPVQQEFEVKGFFEVGMTEFDKNVLLMPLKPAQSFFNQENTLSQIEIFSDNIEQNEALLKTINQTFRTLPIDKSKYQIFGWKHGDSHFFQAVQIERNVMFLILLLIIIIASFNIISGLVMLVKDKTHDIAILKTMGASSASIMRIFILTGAAIGIVGTLFGVILGISVTLNLDAIIHALQSLFQVKIFDPEVYYLTSIPVLLNKGEVALIAGISSILSILSTLYPSLRAARLDPVQALRKG